MKIKLELPVAVAKDTFVEYAEKMQFVKMLYVKISKIKNIIKTNYFNICNLIEVRFFYFHFMIDRLIYIFSN